MNLKRNREDLLGMNFWLYKRWHNVGTRAHWWTEVRFYSLHAAASDHLNQRLRNILEGYWLMDISHATN